MPRLAITGRRGPWAVALTGVLAASSLLAGCGSTSESAGCKPRAIAFLGALTGASRTPPHQNGAELAVHEFNRSHPNCPVGYLFFDSQGDPDIAARLASAMVDDPQILAVVGPGFSGETQAAMPIFDRAHLPVITASATNPTLAEQGWTTFHRVVGNDATQAPAAAAFLSQTLGVKRVAVVDDGGMYGKTLADLVATALGERGIVVAPRASVNPDGLDYRATVASIIDIGVDAIYFGGLTDTSVKLLRQLRDANVSAPFMGGDGILDAALIAGVGVGSDGAYATCPCLDPQLADSTGRSTFAADYLAYFGEENTAFAMEYFDAANLLLDGLDHGVDSRERMDTWIDQADSTGITKQLSFDENGEIRVGQVSVMQVISGSFHQVALVTNGRVALSKP